MPRQKQIRSYRIHWCVYWRQEQPVDFCKRVREQKYCFKNTMPLHYGEKKRGSFGKTLKYVAHSWVDKLRPHVHGCAVWSNTLLLFFCSLLRLLCSWFFFGYVSHRTFRFEVYFVFGEKPHDSLWCLWLFFCLLLFLFISTELLRWGSVDSQLVF